MSTHSPAPPSKGARWAGHVLSGLVGAFLLLDGVAKLFKPVQVVEGTVKLGYPEDVIVPLGITLAACSVLYLIPRTAVLGAILLTGYLGGAVATHVRVGGSAFSIAFGVGFGVLVWLGLYLRKPRLRALVPLR
ncbi:DoxX family protein [Gemmata sp. G18]|uniref:DoxX family protein n=1 Tax=Gemmata palustris TaxID=2822762 RepID=A0ABS5BRX5_9BACT|nr:DoxX family protein [Gemmata palustris]MBP3956492.1 DoxX family protein [Gemmata palustris]